MVRAVLWDADSSWLPSMESMGFSKLQSSCEGIGWYGFPFLWYTELGGKGKAAWNARHWQSP